jgi:hypothetical protein
MPEKTFDILFLPYASTRTLRFESIRSADALISTIAQASPSGTPTSFTLQPYDGKASKPLAGKIGKNSMRH